MSDDRLFKIEEAIQVLLAKHGVTWLLAGVFEPLRDKEAVR